MKTTTPFKLLTITLIFIFTIGPTAASKDTILSGYKSSSGYSQLISSNYANIGESDFSVIPNPITKPNLNLFKNIPISWDPAFMEEAKMFVKEFDNTFKYIDSTPESGGSGTSSGSSSSSGSFSSSESSSSICSGSGCGDGGGWGDFMICPLC